MHRRKLLPLAAAGACAAVLAAPAAGQTLIAHYTFDSTLASETINVVSPSIMTPPAGMLREGTDATTAVAGTAAYGTGVDGTAGGALVLDGIDDWIDLTTMGRPNPATPGTAFWGPGLVSGTVTAWVRTTASDQPMWLLGSDNTADESAFRFGFNGTQLEMQVHAAAANQSLGLVDDTADVSWADGAWRHVAVAWDGISPLAAIYVDGEQVDAVTSGSTLTSSSGDWEFPLALGARDNAGTLEGFWGGLVDDVRVYADALSENQIKQVIDELKTPDANFNGDQFVDGTDFLAWQIGFNTGTLPADGDADGDGVVDEVDLSFWQQQYGEERPAVIVATAVPEPAACALAAAALLALAATNHRCGRHALPI